MNKVFIEKVATKVRSGQVVRDSSIGLKWKYIKRLDKNNRDRWQPRASQYDLENLVIQSSTHMGMTIEWISPDRTNVFVPTQATNDPIN